MEAANRRRVEEAPLYLQGRLERGEALPEVEVVEQSAWVVNEGEGGGYEEEEKAAVARFVVEVLKAELVVELLQAIKPR